MAMLFSVSGNRFDSLLRLFDDGTPARSLSLTGPFNVAGGPSHPSAGKDLFTPGGP